MNYFFLLLFIPTVSYGQMQQDTTLVPWDDSLLLIMVPVQDSAIEVVLPKLKDPLITKNDMWIGVAQLIAGGADATRDHVLHHPNELFRQFPNLNRDFWDIRQSWDNNRWAIFKDANHTFKSIMQTVDLASVVIAMFEGKRSFKRAATKLIFGYICRKIGFHLIYSGLFRNKISIR